MTILPKSLGLCTSVYGPRDALTADKLRRLADAGIEWIEIAALETQHLNCFDESRVDELVEAIETLPLQVWSLHAPFCGLSMDDPETRADGARKLLQATRVAQRFGADRVVVHPGRDVPSVDSEREIAWACEQTARVLDEMPPATVLAFETMGLNSLGGSHEQLLAFVEPFDPERVGVCLDTGHVNVRGDVLERIGALAGRIKAVHLHDNHGDRDAHAMPGEGTIDWPRVLPALREAGYTGPLMGECGWPNGSLEDTVAEYSRRMTDFLQA